MSVQCRKKKSVISWNNDQQMGIVTKKCGKFIQQMGVIHQSIHYLYPEEVCFLVEEGTAEVYIGEQFIDSKIFYDEYLIQLVPPLYYTVYRELRKNSYRVYRIKQFEDFPVRLSKSINSFIWSVFYPENRVSKPGWQVSDYLVCIYSSSDSVPIQDDLTQMLELSSNCNILLAIVDNMNEVFFYEIKNLKSNDWTSPATIVQ